MRYNANNQGEYDHFNVTEGPQPLLEFLLEHVKQSRTKIKQTLHGQGIRVNGKTITQFDYMLQPGMKVAVSKTKRNQHPFKSRYVKIVYGDRWLVVIEKQPGILSNAKDMETEQILEHHWHDIVYDRRYVAVLSGEMEQDEGTIENWLKDNKAYVTYSSPVDNGGKLAITHFMTLDRTTEHSLVEFRLETGRKNQIRVHAADMGHPVCGDPKYGNGDNPLGRLCLHAFLLCFNHPITRRPMEFETTIPAAFKHLFK